MSGNVYTTGYFYNTVDFEPGPIVYNLTAAASGDVFISKLNNAGNFVWAKRIGGNGGDAASDITIDASGRIYTTGVFNLTVDFDPGPLIYNLTNGGAFISNLDSSGNFVWAKSIANSVAYSIRLDSKNNLNLSGSYIPSTVFGMDTLVSVGSFDIFIAKLGNNLTSEIESIETQNNISKYPYPTTNEFSISSPNQPIKEIEINNLLGEKIYSITFTNRQYETIKTESFSSGIYFLKIKTADYSETRKLVVER